MFFSNGALVPITDVASLWWQGQTEVDSFFFRGATLRKEEDLVSGDTKYFKKDLGGPDVSVSL